MINLIYALALFLPLVSAQRGLTVHTQQGDVLGSLSSPTVRRFLGIPFASAKRWEAPQLPPRRSGVFRATNFGSSCPQDFNPANAEYLVLTENQVSNLNVTQTEQDCLSVNVWSPTVERKQNTAVMIWIYGGALFWGTSNISVYDGTNFVRDNEDVAIVSFNYRMNIFGQPNAPQFVSNTSTQNFGLLDVEAAIKWVHDNIAGFGGDPNRITLFGQSAGALAADAYLFSHPNDTIVKGTIQQSGSVLFATGHTVPTNSTLDPTEWNTVAATVGCGNSSTTAQLSCMKAVPFKQLQDAVISTNLGFNLVVDNITVFSDVLERTAAGNFLPAPVLGGTTAQEADIFIVAAEIVAKGFAPPVITELVSDLTTQVEFTCPTGANLMSRASAGVPTWRYQYQAIFPGISTRTDLRAYHSAEIPMVFGTYNGSTVPPSPAEIALSKYIQQAWVAFARDPMHGLVNFGWPLYNPNTTSLAQLGNVGNQTGVVFMQGSMLDASCAQADVLNAASALLSPLS